MSRQLMLLGPLFAFVLPLALSQPSDARPLATPAQPAEWCWGDCGDGGGGQPSEIDLLLCVISEHRMAVDACEIIAGEQCEERCTVEAVTPLCVSELGARAHSRALVACQADALDTCRMQCESGGAGFCEAPAELAAAPTGTRQGLGLGHCNETPGHQENDSHPTPGHLNHNPQCNVQNPPTPPSPKPPVIWIDVDICIAIGDIDIHH